MIKTSFAKEKSYPGVSVNRPRYTANSISLILIFLLSLFVSVAAGCRCEALKKRYKRGFLTLRERDDYCFSGCDFLNLNCERQTETFTISLPDFSKASAAVEELVTKVISGEFDEVGASMLSPDFNEATIDAWKELLGRTWSVALCFIPVILNQYKYYSYIKATALIILFIVLHAFDIMPRTVAVHNILVAITAILHGSNSSSLVESVWTSTFMVIPVFALFIVDPMWHLIMLASVVFGFLAYIRWCFFVRHSGLNASLVIVIAQVFVVADQLWFVKNSMGLNSLAGSAIESLVETILPGGISAMYFFNASNNARNVAKHIPFEFSPVIAYLIALFTQFGFFTFFRASLGAYYLHVLRYKTDFMSLAAGFFVYSADFFGPVSCFGRLAFGYEKMNPRRATYLFVAVVLTVSECRYAREFAVYRAVMSFFDIVVFKSRYGRMAHYLSVDIDFMQAAFPHSGAPPWTAMDVLIHLSEYTSILVSKDKAGKTVRGLGVVLNSAGATLLYSVRHVVADAALATFKTIQYSSPEFNKVTQSKDPLMAMKIATDLEAPDIELLTKTEAFDVQQLVFINCSMDDKRFICFVPEFEIRLGELQAVVNLRKGDSGGPCFAVLGSGVMRLCGVVSRGKPRGGGGNIISFCYSSEEIGADSADEDSLTPTGQFESVRRIRFSSDTPEDMRERAQTSFRKYLSDNTEAFEKMKPWLDHYKWDDLEDDELSVIDRVSLADRSRVQLENRTGDDDDGDDNQPDQARRKGKDAKSRRKDKAYRKRQLDTSKILAEKLKHIYSTQDAKTIFENVARGYVPKLDERNYIVGGNGDHWVLGDCLPDPKWT